MIKHATDGAVNGYEGRPTESQLQDLERFDPESKVAWAARQLGLVWPKKCDAPRSAAIVGRTCLGTGGMTRDPIREHVRHRTAGGPHRGDRAGPGARRRTVFPRTDRAG
ncbi:MAG: hypothetical protein OEO17_14965 [Gemmatimonadota bacterium]|nr:hypothetical protein [Gemmatimonadota bacterium]